MKFKEFLNKLNKYAQENPERLELDVITSIDDEGNGFNLVEYAPSEGVFEDGEWIGSGELKDYNRNKDDINAICVN